MEFKSTLFVVVRDIVFRALIDINYLKKEIRRRIIHANEVEGKLAFSSLNIKFDEFKEGDVIKTFCSIECPRQKKPIYRQAKGKKKIFTIRMQDESLDLDVPAVMQWQSMRNK